MKKTNSVPIPTESAEQQALFRWAAWAQGKYPDLRWMFHVPNGGARDAVTGARMQAEGVKKGVPDICLPTPRGEFSGLYIEMKRRSGGRVSGAQADWIAYLIAQGFCALECRGFDEARRVIENYMALPKPEQLGPEEMMRRYAKMISMRRERNNATV